METALTALASSVGVVAFFGCIAFYNWLEYRRKSAERETVHLERMKALELGQPLPDGEVAWAASDRVRAWMAGLMGILVPLLSAGAAVGATAIVLTLRQHSDIPFAPESPLPRVVLPVVWAVWGLVSVVTVTLSIRTLRHRGSPPGRSEAPIPRNSPVTAHAVVAFEERPPVR
jgi:hypothetical protein